MSRYHQLPLRDALVDLGSSRLNLNDGGSEEYISIAEGGEVTLKILVGDENVGLATDDGGWDLSGDGCTCRVLVVDGEDYVQERDHIPLIVPLTDVTTRPLTKVRYEPAGILAAAVKLTVAPADGGLPLLGPL